MEVQFSDEPIEGIEKSFEEWVQPPEFAPPPPAGTYRVYIDQIRSEEEFNAIVDGREVKRYRCVLDLRILGGAHDGRVITFQRLTNRENLRKATGTTASQLLDVVKATGVSSADLPNSNKKFSLFVRTMKDRGAAMSFGVQIDWRGFCGTCYERKLMELTGTVTADAAKDAAKSSPDCFNEASDYATKAKNYRGFPPNPAGGLKDSFICDTCREEVRASVRLTRIIKETSNG